MASSDNLASLHEPWLFQSPYTSEPSWLTETHIPPKPIPRGSGSDPDTTASKRAGPGPASGRVGKRKPRASKKNPTTYITADAANFRQMVQQVTGLSFPAPAHVLKPEPQRFGGGGMMSQGAPFLIGVAGASPAELPFDDVACFPILDSWKAL